MKSHTIFRALICAAALALAGGCATQESAEQEMAESRGDQEEEREEPLEVDNTMEDEGTTSPKGEAADETPTVVTPQDEADEIVEEATDSPEIEGMVAMTATAKVSGAGELDTDIIATTLERRAEAMTNCWQREIDQQETPSANAEQAITLNFDVKQTGRVEAVSLVDYAGPESLSECIVPIIERLRFPRPKGGVVNVEQLIEMSAREAQ